MAQNAHTPFPPPPLTTTPKATPPVVANTSPPLSLSLASHVRLPLRCIRTKAVITEQKTRNARARASSGLSPGFHFGIFPIECYRELHSRSSADALPTLPSLASPVPVLLASSGQVLFSRPLPRFPLALSCCASRSHLASPSPSPLPPLLPLHVLTSRVALHASAQTSEPVYFFHFGEVPETKGKDSNELKTLPPLPRLFFSLCVLFLARYFLLLLRHHRWRPLPILLFKRARVLSSPPPFRLLLWSCALGCVDLFGTCACACVCLSHSPLAAAFLASLKVPFLLSPFPLSLTTDGAPGRACACMCVGAHPLYSPLSPLLFSLSRPL